MKKLLLTLTGIIATALIFAGGIFASQWISFTGGDSLDQADNDVEEIMQILRDTHKGKIDAEEALAELKELNPPGLVNKIDELEKEIEQLKTEKAVLVTDNNSLKDDLEKEKEAHNKLKNDYNKLSEDLESMTAERDSIQSDYNDLLLDYNSSSEYIAHLESELTEANNAVESHSNVITEAVEEARAYK